MATVPETKNETSPQKLNAESKKDNAGCAASAEKCDLTKQQQPENNECRVESADNLKNLRKDDKQEDGDVVSHPAAEKNGAAQQQPSSSPAKKESRKKTHDQSSPPEPDEDQEKDEDEDGEDDEDHDDDDEDEEPAGEPDTKRRRTLDTNELAADKEKVDLSENGPEEVEELKNGSSAKN